MSSHSLFQGPKLISACVPGSFWVGIVAVLSVISNFMCLLQSNLFQVNLGSNLQSVSSSPVQVSFNSTSPQPEEGSFIWKHGSFYYLFFSSGMQSIRLVTHV